MQADVKYDFSGKVAVITGGSSGIGLAAARAFVRAGASVAIAARTEVNVENATKELQAIVKESGSNGGAIGVVADMSKAEGFQKLVDEAVKAFGGIDIAMSNAGGSGSGPFLELTDEMLMGGIGLKLLGAVRLTQAVAPIMESRGGGAVVCIGATAGKDPKPTRIPAATTNTAMRTFVKAAALDLAPRGISINIIQPGLVRTQRQRFIAEYAAEQRKISVDEVMKEQEAASPTGRVTEPEEVADLTLFLSSRSVFNLTGAEVVLDAAATPGI
jgi:3-oxoacyl-[acyl-carrier protein] reductase